MQVKPDLGPISLPPSTETLPLPKKVQVSGKVDAQLSTKKGPSAAANLSANVTADHAAVDASGKLILADGKLSAADGSKLGVSFGGTKLKAGASITALGQGASGSADLKLEDGFEIGFLRGNASAGSKVSVSPYAPSANNPDDAVRLASGQSYQAWSGQFEAQASVGASAILGAAGIPVQLGAKAGGAKGLKATAIILASDDPRLIRMPSSAQDVRAMQPGEAWSDTADRSVLIGGNVALGYRVPNTPAGLTVGGDVSYNVKGSFERQFDRLEGDQVRVRIKRGAGDSDVKSIALGSSIAVAGGLKLPSGKVAQAITDKALPMLERAAQAGFKETWQKNGSDDIALEFMVDLSSPIAADALTRLLHDDFTGAQALALQPKSGVVLTQAVETTVRSESDEESLSLGLLKENDLDQWLDAKVKSADAAGEKFEETIKGSNKEDAILPWSTDWSSDVSLLHRQRVSLGSAGGADLGRFGTRLGIAHPFEEAPITAVDSTISIGLRAGDTQTSQSDLLRWIQTGSALLDAMGLAKEDRQGFEVLAAAIREGKTPTRTGLALGLVDRRYGKTEAVIEGAVSKAGLHKILSTGREEAVAAYLEILAGTSATPLIISKLGIAQKVAERLSSKLDAGCVAAPVGGGAYEILGKDTGERVAHLSAEALATAQAQILEKVQSAEPEASIALPSFGTMEVQGPQPLSAPLTDQVLSMAAATILSTVGLAPVDKNPSFAGPGRPPRPGAKTWAPEIKSSGGDYSASQSALREAKAFADQLEEAQRFVEKALDPKAPMGSTAFYDQMDRMFRAMMKDQIAPRLSLLALAGTEGAFIRGGLAMDRSAVETMRKNGVPVKPSADGADFYFSAGVDPTSAELALALPGMDKADGSWMRRPA
ncbi:MAG: hypothetical protein U1E65_02910 [Myxococcota bacterium]